MYRQVSRTVSGNSRHWSSIMKPHAIGYRTLAPNSVSFYSGPKQTNIQISPSPSNIRVGLLLACHLHPTSVLDYCFLAVFVQHPCWTIASLPSSSNIRVGLLLPCRLRPTSVSDYCFLAVFVQHPCRTTPSSCSHLAY